MLVQKLYGTQPGIDAMPADGRSLYNLVSSVSVGNLHCGPPVIICKLLQKLFASAQVLVSGFFVGQK